MCVVWWIPLILTWVENDRINEASGQIMDNWKSLKCINQNMEMKYENERMKVKFSFGV